MNKSRLGSQKIDIHTGHRKRLKEKFLKAPLRTFGDYEILEMLLFCIYPRSDTKPIAKKLLVRFGSIKEVIFSDPAALKIDCGVGDSVITFFKLIQDLISRIHIPQDHAVNVISNWNAVLNYCKLTMSHRNEEEFRVLFLNNRNILISDELMQKGTVDRVVVYPREIAKRAVVNSASAVILVHNHPSGDAKPSPDDIDITKKIITVLASINVSVHDHLIIAKEKVFSFRNSGLI